MRGIAWRSARAAVTGAPPPATGYYGGLQFSRRTWHSYGGGAYAGTTNYASRLQQIDIAEKVLSTQGWKAWPTCARRAGVL